MVGLIWFLCSLVQENKRFSAACDCTALHHTLCQLSLLDWRTCNSFKRRSCSLPLIALGVLLWTISAYTELWGERARTARSTDVYCLSGNWFFFFCFFIPLLAFWFCFLFVWESICLELQYVAVYGNAKIFFLSSNCQLRLCHSIWKLCICLHAFKFIWTAFHLYLH